jgi:choline dehydrogenase
VILHNPTPPAHSAATCSSPAAIASVGMDSFDFIVVGAGTAGCVVAARLSEEPDRRVLLIEAGRNGGPDAMSVPAMWPTLMGSDVDWGLQTVPQTGLDAAVLPYPQGKVLGGSSGINAMAHLRADRSSYDHWAIEGATGWGFDDLLPYFQRTENAQGRDPHFRGTAGPLTIERAAETHPAAEAFFQACKERGYPMSDDLNGARSEGICWYDRNIVAGRRQSAADAYLRPILGRPNLTVHTGATVTNMVVTHNRVAGVTYGRGASEQRSVHAEREIILCAGAIGSPRLLQLAGIGPAQHLGQQGIDVVADLPGVGANLADHPLAVLVYSASQPLPASANNHFDTLAAVRTDPASTTPDTHILFCNVPLPPRGRSAPAHGYSIEFAMLRPHSRGTVRLASSDPTAAPLVDPGFLIDERDVAFMLRAARAAREVGEAAALEPWRATEVIPGPLVSTDEQLRTYLRQSTGTYFHPVGTCRMGTDANAVTDAALRVHGVDGLRVVDASVMPSLPAANTNATVFAIAEKATDLIRASA